MRVELRHVLPGAPPADGGQPELRERLRAEIEAGGPITFARFMSRALYEPGLGYYATSADRPARSGDFLTAPELHPVFGHALAGQLDQLWQHLGTPPAFTLREYGAGRGALVSAVVEGLRRRDSALLGRLCYQPIDLPAQLAQVRQRLTTDRAADIVDGTASDQPFSGCVIANEYLDALPVQRVVMDAGRLREIHIDWRAGEFVEVAGDLSDARISNWFEQRAISLAEGQRAEVNLAMLDWLSSLAEQLERGFVLIFDYGATGSELYGPERAGGTLRAYRGQHVSSDALADVGRRDITAHIDLDALEAGATAAGFDVIGRTRQAEFLLGAGLDEAYAAAREESDGDWPAALELRSAVRRLLDPRGMGGFAVVVLGRNVAQGVQLRGLERPAAAPAARA